MELMNKDLLMLTKDLALNLSTAFKQDAKLAEAIDKLHSSQRVCLNVRGEGGLVLPERKLEFQEVQQLLKQSTKSINGKYSY